jgi:hypothetical protein
MMVMGSIGEIMLLDFEGRDAAPRALGAMKAQWYRGRWLRARLLGGNTGS